MSAITQPQLHILRHSLGLDDEGYGREYRNHFVTGEGNNDHRICMELVKAGWMLHRPGNQLTGGDDCFVVSEAGKILVRGLTKPRKKLTRSQQFYREFLAVDTGETFKEYMKRVRGKKT